MATDMRYTEKMLFKFICSLCTNKS